MAVLTLWNPGSGPEPGSSGPACSNQGDGNVIEGCSVEFEHNVGPDTSEDKAKSNYDDNVGGWAQMIEKAREYAERVAV